MANETAFRGELVRHKELGRAPEIVFHRGYRMKHKELPMDDETAAIIRSWNAAAAAVNLPISSTMKKELLLRRLRLARTR